MKKMFAAIGAAALVTVGLAAPASAVETKYDLIAGGGTVASAMDIGDVYVEDTGTEITVRVVVNGQLNPDSVVPTKIYGISAEAGCAVTDFPLSKGNPVPGQMEFQQSFPDGVTQYEFTLARPNCADPKVFVHTDAKQLGDWAGLNQVVLSGETTAQFKVVTDAGSDPGASYFDTTFITGPFAGQTFDGYCVDIGATIGTGTIYTGTLVTLDELVNSGNIDKPEFLPAVMWLINNYKPGDVVDWTDDGIANGVVLTSGTIQRAIWYLVDLTQSTSGLGTFSDAQAQYLAALARNNNVLPASACGQLIPIVLVIGGQTTIGQTTLVNIDIPCETRSETAVAMNTAVQVKEGANMRYGEQFPGSNWFSYVIAPTPPSEPAV